LPEAFDLREARFTRRSGNVRPVEVFTRFDGRDPDDTIDPHS
jgi:hypothetical protein